MGRYSYSDDFGGGGGILKIIAVILVVGAVVGFLIVPMIGNVGRRINCDVCGATVSKWHIVHIEKHNALPLIDPFSSDPDDGKPDQFEVCDNCRETIYAKIQELRGR